MSVAFDTLKLARKLEEAGFARDQANGATEALADAFSAEIATKTDLASLRADLRPDIANLRVATAQWIIGAVLVNLAGMVGLVIAVWQLARR